MKVAVVIPFFQRTPGLLATAVQSVAAQQVPAYVNFDIIIVDDGSPISAASEALGNLPVNCSLRIILRPNGGVAAARNTGLDAAARDTNYVAFLDSDDSWAPGHINNAINNLQHKADFYFDNNLCDLDVDNFSYHSYMKQMHPEIDSDTPAVRRIGREEAFNAMLTDFIPHTSQVVYNFVRHHSLRFDSDQKWSSEDYLFFLALAFGSRTTVYSTAIMGYRGHGVSIYRETLSWDSPNGLNRILDQMVARKKTLTIFNLSHVQRSALQRELQEMCTHFVLIGLRNCIRQPRVFVAALARMTRDIPQIWQMMPASLWRLRSYRTSLLENK